MTRLTAFLFVPFAGMIAGCEAELPTCDPAAAREIVYLDGATDAAGDDGLPMYAGQALLHRSCGGGAYCHSEAAVGAFRFGVPAGLDLELGIPCVDQLCEDEPSRLERFRVHHARVTNSADALYTAVVRGTMPPGEAGDRVRRRMPLVRRAVAGSSLESGPLLPEIETPEGQRTFGTWLACGAPSIVVTLPSKGALSAGDACNGSEDTSTYGDCIVHGALLSSSVSPTYAVIHANIIEPLCASTCHGAESPRARLALGDGEEAAYRELLRIDRAQVLVTPGRPQTSHLLYHLLDAEFGERMPLGIVRASLPSSAIETIRSWIEAGAPR